MTKSDSEDIQNTEFMMEDVVIRRVKRSDLEALEWEGEFIRYRNIYLEVFKRMRRGDAKMWVAELEKSKLIGQVFVQYYLRGIFNSSEKKHAYIHGFRVRPEYSRAGLGTRLMKFAENAIIEKSIFTVNLNVAKDNQGALRLYKNLGYKLFGETPGRWWYHDHKNKLQVVEEPSWRLTKKLK